MVALAPHLPASASPALLGAAATRPLLLSGDPLATLLAGGAELREGAPIGVLLREWPAAVAAAHDRELSAGCDVVCALSAHTEPRVLAAAGMAFRSAALTSVAVELACEATRRVGRPALVAATLGGVTCATGRALGRITEAYETHAARLATTACELVVVRGDACGQQELALHALLAAVVSACATERVVWAVVPLAAGGHGPDGEPLEHVARMLGSAGARALLLDARRLEDAVAALEHLDPRVSPPAGVLLSASDDLPPPRWAEAAMTLARAGARLLGGGAGAGAEHTRALAQLLTLSDRGSPRAQAL